MAYEIERKFMVGGDGWQAAVSGSRDIEQAYLAVTEAASVRLRIVDGRSAWITVKGRLAGRVRPEYEYSIPADDARAMLALCAGQIIAKRRHDVLWDGTHWIVDVFGGALAGLVIAECELDAEDAEIGLPEWVGVEVTSDQRYYNQNLGLQGMPADALNRLRTPASTAAP